MEKIYLPCDETIIHANVYFPIGDEPYPAAAVIGQIDLKLQDQLVSDGWSIILIDELPNSEGWLAAIIQEISLQPMYDLRKCMLIVNQELPSFRNADPLPFLRIYLHDSLRGKSYFSGNTSIRFFNDMNQL